MSATIQPRDYHAIRMIEALTQDLMDEGWPEQEAKQEARRMWRNRPIPCGMTVEA